MRLVGHRAHAAHHLVHLAPLLHKAIDLGGGHAGTLGDAGATLAVDDGRTQALLLGHRHDDGLVLVEDALIQVAAHLVERALAAGKHAQNALHTAHLLDGLHLVEHVVHGKALAQHALGSLELLGIGCLLGFLDNADDVAHAQDALGHAIGIERLQRIGLLAHAHELDGLAGHLAHRKRAAATGIAVELGDDHAVKVGALGEGRDNVDDILAGHGIDDHQHLIGLDGLLDVHGLLHHLLVDLQTTGGIDDDHIAQVVDGLLDGALGNIDRVLAVTAEDRHADLSTKRGQLVGSGGTVDVARGEQRRAALLLEQVCQLYSRRGLTGALQAHEHNDVGNAVAKDELALGGAEHLGELVEHDLDDVLRRRQRFHDLGGHAALLGLGDKLLDDLKVDVGLE